MSNTLSNRALCTLEDVRNALGWATGENTDQDDRLTGYINFVTREMHKVSGREFVSYSQGEAARDFLVPDSYGHSRRVRSLRIDDCQSITTVESFDNLFDDSGVDITSDVKAWPLAREPWEPITRLLVDGLWVQGELLRVTGLWGFPAVPDDVKQAAIDGVKALHDRHASWTEEYLEAAEPRRIRSSLPDVAFYVANSYRRESV